MGKKETKFFNADAGGPTSANINRISYYQGDETLEVKYKNGAVYQFEGVSAELWEKARTAPSIGKFMNENIKGAYSYQIL